MKKYPSELGFNCVKAVKEDAPGRLHTGVLSVLDLYEFLKERIIYEEEEDDLEYMSQGDVSVMINDELYSVTRAGFSCISPTLCLDAKPEGYVYKASKDGLANERQKKMGKNWKVINTEGVEYLEFLTYYHREDESKGYITAREPITEVEIYQGEYSGTALLSVRYEEGGFTPNEPSRAYFKSKGRP